MKNIMVLLVCTLGFCCQQSKPTTGEDQQEGNLSDFMVSAPSSVSFTYPPQPKSDYVPKGNRYATEEDAKIIHNANPGDYIIDTPTTGKPKNSIYIHPNQKNDFKLGPGQKILIMGGDYGFIQLHLPRCEGTESNPIVITNFNGQVRIRGSLRKGASPRFLIGNGIENFKLTGKYDPVAQTGDENFQGHLKGYSFNHGTYGFMMDQEWENTNRAGLTVEAQTTFEIEYIEVANGGFAGLSIKNDNPSNPSQPMNIDIHDCFIHDTGSEGIYAGYFRTSEKQHKITGKIHHNRFVRCGTEAIQVGNQGDSCDIYNNVIVAANTTWKSPFQRFHDNGVQLKYKEGTGRFRNNILLGCGGNFMYISFDDKGGVPSRSRPVIIENNLFAYARYLGVFIAKGTDSITPVIFRSNYWSNLEYEYDEVYTDRNKTNCIFKSAGDNTIKISGNIYDTKEVITNQDLLADANTRARTIQMPQFKNSGFPRDFDYRKIEIWSAKIGENDRFTATYPDRSLKGQPNYYKKGDFCLKNSKIYLNVFEGDPMENHGVDPEKDDGTYWVQQVWEKPDGSMCPYPPDNFKLTEDALYSNVGMGL